MTSVPFKKGLLSEEADRLKSQEVETVSAGVVRYDGKELREANELKWELFLERDLHALGRIR